MPKLWVGICEPCVVDLIQHVQKSGIILIIEKEDFPQFDEEKVQQESKELEGLYIVKNAFDASATQSLLILLF